ncbi:MAG: EAL domain-containing response regulator [Pseudomonadota bacterium]
MKTQTVFTSRKPQPGTMLIIDDDAGIRGLIRSVAERQGFEVTDCGRSEDAADAAEERAPAVITLDLSMPGCDGIEVLRQLSAKRIRARIYLISGLCKRVLATASDLARTLDLDVAGTLRKPFDIAQLRALLAEEWRFEKVLTAADLRHGIERGELVVHYQPRVKRHGERWVISGVEALCRWQHAQHGLVMPDAFIPIAERSGAIGALTNYVLRETIEQLARWEAAGHRLTASVNISGALLGDLELPDRLATMLSTHGLTPDRLILEITETAAMADPALTMDILTRLRVKGFDVAMDDFGIGFSSMQHLFRLPFSELKIDKSFVLEISKSANARTLVSALVELAHNFDMSACAEGIEDEDILGFLTDAGCDTGQGFLFSPAVPEQELIGLVESDAFSTSQDKVPHSA